MDAKGNCAVSRWDKFTFKEREILRILLEDHLSSVSEISLLMPHMEQVSYFLPIEKMETELKMLLARKRRSSRSEEKANV
jgi:hypothetical protein